MFLGLDTSNYTTSAALFSDRDRRNVGRLLDVAPGQLGLRQSDALFQHVKKLPDIVDELFSSCSRSEIRSVAASTRPRAVEGSYMPCFLAGKSLGRSLAATLGVPFYSFSHQQGHIAAALFSADRLDLLQSPHLAWHLSGGTTELLHVTPDPYAPNAQRIGGTSDLSAGQIIDRTGQRLGLNFPAGKTLDALAEHCNDFSFYRVKTENLSFSFSGIENKMMDLLEKGATSEQVAYYVLFSVSDAVRRVTEEALRRYPNAPVLFSGGVSSNRLLRRVMKDYPCVFAAPEYSTDNAMGIAVLASLQEG